MTWSSILSSSVKAPPLLCLGVFISGWFLCLSSSPHSRTPAHLSAGRPETFPLHTDNMLGTLCSLLAALTCKEEAASLQLWPHVPLIRVSSSSLTAPCFLLCFLLQVWALWLWWHSSLLLWRWPEERRPPSTVTWGALLMLLLAGTNRYLEEFLSMYCIFTNPGPMWNMVLDSPHLISHLLVSPSLIVAWSSIMWRMETQPFITVAHGMVLLKNTYHSDLHHDKNLFPEHFCFSALSDGGTVWSLHDQPFLTPSHDWFIWWKPQNFPWWTLMWTSTNVKHLTVNTETGH